MRYNQLLEPKEIVIEGQRFAISRIPAIKAIPIHSAIVEAIQKNGALGTTMLNEQTQRAILQYVCADNNGSWDELTTDSSINSFCKDYFVLMSVVKAMVEENFGFFGDGRLLKLLEAEQAETE